MCLRVNALRCTRDDYLKLLADADIDASQTQYSDCGVMLDSPQDVAKLPGFADGLVSVQDESAQLAASLLDVQPGHRSARRLLCPWR